MSKEMKISEIVEEIDALISAGEDAKAETRLLEAIAQYTETEPGNVVGQSVLFNELGSFYKHRGVFDKGEAAYLKAKALLEETRRYTYVVDGPAMDCGCCSCVARDYSDPWQKDGNGEAQSHQEVAYSNESMTANYATTLNNLAGLYRMDKQFQKALETFDAAINVYQNCEDGASPDYFASSYNNKGLVYLDMREVDQARAMFLTAKEILEQGGEFKFAMATTISNLAFAAVIENQFAEAAECFKQAKTLFAEAGSHEMAKSCEAFQNQLEAVK